MKSLTFCPLKERPNTCFDTKLRRSNHSLLFRTLPRGAARIYSLKSITSFHYYSVFLCRCTLCFFVFPDDFGLNRVFVHNWTKCEGCSSFVMYFRRLQLQKHHADDACRARGGTRTLFEKKNMSPPPPLRAVTGMQPCNRTNLSINRALNSRQVAASA